MQQHLQRLDGVAKVEVSLLDGEVVIFPKAGVALDPATILKATYDSGVSVIELGITASGSLGESNGELLFRPSEQQSFAISPSPLVEELKQSVGREVSIRGRLFQIPKGASKPRTLPEELPVEVLEIR